MAAILLAFALFAQDAGAPSIETCRTQANTIEMNECGMARIALERERMEGYLAAARGTLGVYAEDVSGDHGIDLAADLERSQAAWEAYAEARCGALYNLNIMGTIRGIVFAGCMEDMVHQRTRELWTDYLADAGSDLPEPVAPAADAVLGEPGPT